MRTHSDSRQQPRCENFESPTQRLKDTHSRVDRHACIPQLGVGARAVAAAPTPSLGAVRSALAHTVTERKTRWTDVRSLVEWRMTLCGLFEPDG